MKWYAKYYDPHFIWFFFQFEAIIDNNNSEAFYDGINSGRELDSESKSGQQFFIECVCPEMYSKLLARGYRSKNAIRTQICVCPRDTHKLTFFAYTRFKRWSIVRSDTNE